MKKYKIEKDEATGKLIKKLLQEEFGMSDEEFAEYLKECNKIKEV